MEQRGRRGELWRERCALGPAHGRRVRWLHVLAEGAGQSHTFTVTDLAGNAASATVAGVNIDRTAPQLALSTNPAPNAAGWNTTDVTASYSASDALSGLAGPATGGFVFSMEGAGQSHAFTVTDRAGNAATATATVSIDRTPPTIVPPADQTLLATSGAGAAATFAATVSDALSSGVVVVYSHPSGSTFPIGRTTVTITATDAAGNRSTSSFRISVWADVQILSPADGQTLDVNQTVSASFSGGGPSAEARLDGASIRNGATIDAFLLSAGGHTLTVQPGEAPTQPRQVAFSVRASVTGLIPAVQRARNEGLIDGSTAKSILSRLEQAQEELRRGKIKPAIAHLKSVAKKLEKADRDEVDPSFARRAVGWVDELVGRLEAEADPPSVWISDASVTEGAAGATSTATLMLTLSEDSPIETSVAWATAPGTAAAGSDYASASGRVTFAAGQTTAKIFVSVLGDNVVEPDETFTVVLSDPRGLTIGGATGTVRIVNDDLPPRTISIADLTVTEGRDDKTATITLTLSSASSSAISVTATTVAGSASAGSDYVHKTGTVTFAAGKTQATFTVTIRGDTLAEPTELFDVVLSAPTGGATIARGSARITIVDDDGARGARGAQHDDLTATAAPPAGARAVLALSRTELDRAIELAKARWLAVEPDADFSALTVAIGDLPGLVLGRAIGSHVVIDATAAGWGWDAMHPGDDAPRMDLVTAVAHELGHVLAHEHAGSGVMLATLAAVRNAPAPHDAGAPPAAGRHERSAAHRPGRRSTSSQRAVRTTVRDRRNSCKTRKTGVGRRAGRCGSGPQQRKLSPAAQAMVVLLDGSARARDTIVRGRRFATEPGLADRARDSMAGCFSNTTRTRRTLHGAS